MSVGGALPGEGGGGSEVEEGLDDILHLDDHHSRHSPEFEQRALGYLVHENRVQIRYGEQLGVTLGPDPSV